MNVPRVFTCSICGEASTRICVWCTKDACDNHLCRKCRRCSDCCECEVPLEAPEAAPSAEPETPGEYVE
jgi:transcription elongation factor Elf1